MVIRYDGPRHTPVPRLSLRRRKRQRSPSPHQPPLCRPLLLPVAPLRLAHMLRDGAAEGHAWLAGCPAASSLGRVSWLLVDRQREGRLQQQQLNIVLVPGLDAGSIRVVSLSDLLHPIVLAALLVHPVSSAVRFSGPNAHLAVDAVRASLSTTRPATPMRHGGRAARATAVSELWLQLRIRRQPSRCLQLATTSRASDLEPDVRPQSRFQSASPSSYIVALPSYCRIEEMGGGGSSRIGRHSHPCAT